MVSLIQKVYFQPYLFTDMIWVNRLPNALAFSKRMLYLHSNQPNKQSNLLCSQFHFKGIRHFQKSRQLTRSSALFQTDKLVTQLEKKRQKTLQLKALQMSKQDQQLANRAEYIGYVETYEKLVQKVREIKIGEEWAYRMIGWYNMQPYLQLLIEQLISKADKSQYQLLIESINWMQPHQLTLNTQQSIQEVMKHKTKIDHFYKHLNYGYPISTLRQVQSILGSTMTQTKSKYYHHYTLNNCPNILKTTPPTTEELEDILWLLEMYVSTYNDSPQVIRQFEEYLFLHKTDLSKTATTFIKIYNQLGRANPQIYRHFVKPLFASNPHKIIDQQIINLEFLIHSQINDAQALNETFKNIAKIVRTQPISQGHRLHIHYLMHYLKIKNMPFNFPFSIARDFTQTCRNFEEDASLAKQMAIQLDQKSRREGVEYYNSNCVLKKKNFEGKATAGEQIKKVQGFKKYKNIKFCCLNIDLCVYDPSSKKAVVLQKNYHRLNHSGRLVRMEQVKEVILKHYGFDINYLQTKYEQSKRSQV